MRKSNKIRQRARNTSGDPAIYRPPDLLKAYIVADFANDDQLLPAIEKGAQDRTGYFAGHFRNIKIKNYNA